ncbi:MAG: hypothetical protein ACLVIY_15235 [Anaerobutyricum soehngenii]
MKITKVTPILVNRFLYVEVETDEGGIKGVGESGAWGFLETGYAAVNEISRCTGIRTGCKAAFSSYGTICIV